MLTPEIRDAIATNANLGEVARLCKQQGMTTMLEDGRNKVLRGLTTPSEVLAAVFTSIDQYNEKPREGRPALADGAVIPEVGPSAGPGELDI